MLIHYRVIFLLYFCKKCLFLNIELFFMKIETFKKIPVSMLLIALKRQQEILSLFSEKFIEMIKNKVTKLEFYDEQSNEKFIEYINNEKNNELLLRTIIAKELALKDGINFLHELITNNFEEWSQELFEKYKKEAEQKEKKSFDDYLIKLKKDIFPILKFYTKYMNFTEKQQNRKKTMTPEIKREETKALNVEQYEEITTKLREWREHKHISIYGLSCILEMRPETVKKIENGEQVYSSNFWTYYNYYLNDIEK